MSTVIDNIERAQLRRVPEFRAGDRLRVHFVVIEGSRRRTQVFEGVAIKRQGQGVRETFTVRKQSFGVGVERTFPLHSPKIERIEVAARGDVRRAKLYYLRDRVGKRARVRERGYVGPEVAIEPGLLHGVEAADSEAAETSEEFAGEEAVETAAAPELDGDGTDAEEASAEAVEDPPAESEDSAEEPQAGAESAVEAEAPVEQEDGAETEQPAAEEDADEPPEASEEAAAGEPESDSPDEPA